MGEKNRKSIGLFNSLLIVFVLIIVLLVVNNMRKDNQININEEGQLEENSNEISENDEKSEEIFSSDLNNHELDESRDNVVDNQEDVTSQNDVDHDGELDNVYPIDFENIKVKEELKSIENRYNSSYVSVIKKLEDAVEFFFEAKGTITDDTDFAKDIDLINNAVMAILRKDRYYDGGTGMESVFWGTIAGSTNPSVKGALKLLGDDLEASIASINTSTIVNGDELTEMEIEAIRELLTVVHEVEQFDEFSDPISGEPIDFIHMMASLDSVYTNIDMEDDIEMFVDYLAGWAGDLLTFLPDYLDEIDKGTMENSEYKVFIKSTLGSGVKSHFSGDDLLADIDAININTILKSDNLLLSEGIIWYYNSRALKSRYSSFVNSFGSEEEFNLAVRIIVMYQYVEDSEISKYDFVMKDFRGVMRLFEDIFKHRVASKEELEVLYEGFYEIIIERMTIEVERSW